MKGLLRLYFVLFSIFPTILSGQDRDSVRSIMKAELVAHGLTYRDLYLDYSIGYDSLESRYKMNVNRKMDVEILSGLERRVGEYLNNYAVDNIYGGTIYFDGYTGEIFINIREQDEVHYFYSTPVAPQPEQGFEKFLKRWQSYLHGLRKYKDERLSNIDQDHIFSFFVDRDGSIVVDKESDIDSVLYWFVSKEKWWHPGIMSGRPEVVRYDLALLNEDVDIEVQDNLLRSNKVFPAFTKSRDVFYSNALKQINWGDYNIVSMLMYDGKLVSPVLHAGSRKQCQVLIERLDKTAIDTWRAGQDLRRIYFYTEIK